MGAQDSRTGTWVYCVVRSDKAPSLARAPDGPPGTGRPRALKVADRLYLLVSDAPLSVYGTGPLNARLEDLDWVSGCAVAHENVVAFARRFKAMVPLKLFTLFLSDQRAVAWAKGERTRLARALTRVAGCAEYGVRLTLDEKRAKAAAQAQLSPAAATGAGTSGAAFLMRKKQVKEAAADVVQKARRAGDALFEDLQAKTKDAQRRQEVEGLAPGSRLLLDAVFLVPDAGTRKFEAAVDAATRALSKQGYDLTLNGPWPPYHFVAGAA